MLLPVLISWSSFRPQVLNLDCTLESPGSLKVLILARVPQPEMLRVFKSGDFQKLPM